ncbi:XkdX family protein [Pseudobacillus badius]|nr:XkdX family protein [Bacillus badius]UAT31981.1 XkdX family protein [Bacillus badius]
MNFWEWAYKNQYADKEDLKAAVALNDLTQEEYKQLTDEIYKDE